jgi:hypothetical protein
MAEEKSSVRKRGRVVGDDMQLQSIARNTTGYLRSTRHTTPMGLPSFPNPPNRTTEKAKVIAARTFTQASRKQTSEASKRSTILGGGELAITNSSPVVVASSKFESTEVWLR